MFNVLKLRKLCDWLGVTRKARRTGWNFRSSLLWSSSASLPWLESCPAITSAHPNRVSRDFNLVNCINFISTANHPGQWFSEAKCAVKFIRASPTVQSPWNEKPFYVRSGPYIRYSISADLVFARPCFNCCLRLTIFIKFWWEMHTRYWSKCLNGTWGK